MIKFDVFNRWTGAIQFTAEIKCADDEVQSVKLGLAVKWAFKTGASLVGASLVGARLDGASLDGARLDGARLVGARLDGASLDGYTLAKGQSWAALGWPDGWYAYTFFTKEGEQRVKIGCQNKTIAEGREYWRGKEDRQEVFAALDYAEAVGRARGWVSKGGVK